MINILEVLMIIQAFDNFKDSFTIGYSGIGMKRNFSKSKQIKGEGIKRNNLQSN